MKSWTSSPPGLHERRSPQAICDVFMQSGGYRTHTARNLVHGWMGIDVEMDGSIDIKNVFNIYSMFRGRGCHLTKRVCDVFMQS